MSMADRDGYIWYDGKLVPWRSSTPPLGAARLRTAGPPR